MPVAMHMMIGNVGGGKSEMAAHMAKKWNAVICNMDAIQESMHGFYGGYREDLKPVYQATEESIISGALSVGVPVIIDRTNMDRKRRERFIKIANAYGAEVKAYVMSATMHDALDRRMKHPRGLTQEKWWDVISRMVGTFEYPTLEEGFSTIEKLDQRHRFIAYDFDGTIVGNNFPDIGEPIEKVIEHMKKFWHESLFNRIIIWTCRGGNYAAQAEEFLRQQKIPYDFINENPIVDYGGQKVFAHEYIDDRAINAMDIK